MASFSETLRFCFPAERSSGISYNTASNTTRYGQSHGSQSHFTSAALGRDSTTTAFSVSKLVRSYWFDWLLIAILCGVLFVLNRTPGHKREFSLTDISIQHTFAEKERVPSGLLAFISVGIPLIFLIPISTFVSRSPWDVHNGLIGLGMSYTVTGVVTQVIKMMVGRPRPDLIARCIPKVGAVDHPVFGLSTAAICTTDDIARLNDGFKSFPSGHSSLSFAGLGFLTFYLAGKMHLWDKHGHRTRAWFALSPLLGGAMVAISRTEDNRHHWQDVLVGSLLGLSIAFVAYRTYYPPLMHPACHLPLLPLEADDEDEDVDRYGYARDEETGDLVLPQRVRLLSEENGVPRPSEEEVAWREQQP